jgi:LPS-assembly lipoprotein
MRALTVLALLALAGCGFQLRGTASLPFETLYMAPTTQPGAALDLKRNIQAGTRTAVIDDPKKADAQLEFMQESRQKIILSLGGTGRVREYRLVYTVGFRVHDGKGGEFVPASTVVLAREITFNDSAVLAKETEEALIYRDMQSDMVRQLMRRLAAAQKPKPAQ